MSWLAAVQALDESVLAASRGAPAWAVAVFLFATHAGGGWGLFAVVPFAFRARSRRLTLWLLGAVVVTAVTVAALKATIGRARPCDVLSWCEPVGVLSPGGDSFPSGHAAGAFTFAAFLAMRFPRLAPLLLSWAALVAWSRCALGVHYPSDVTAGALLGALIGVAFALVSREARADADADADATASSRSGSRCPPRSPSRAGGSGTPG